MFGIQAYALMQGKFWCSVTLTYLVQNPRSASRLQDVQFDKASSMESLNSKASTQKLPQSLLATLLDQKLARRTCARRAALCAL
jgi:hypothetical protein